LPIEALRPLVQKYDDEVRAITTTVDTPIPIPPSTTTENHVVPPVPIIAEKKKSKTNDIIYTTKGYHRNNHQQPTTMSTSFRSVVEGVKSPLSKKTNQIKPVMKADSKVSDIIAARNARERRYDRERKEQEDLEEKNENDDYHNDAKGHERRNRTIDLKPYQYSWLNPGENELPFIEETAPDSPIPRLPERGGKGLGPDQAPGITVYSMNYKKTTESEVVDNNLCHITDSKENNVLPGKRVGATRSARARPQTAKYKYNNNNNNNKQGETKHIHAPTNNTGKPMALREFGKMAWDASRPGGPGKSNAVLDWTNPIVMYTNPNSNLNSRDSIR
jgi:hypothetical protein